MKSTALVFGQTLLNVVHSDVVMKQEPSDAEPHLGRAAQRAQPFSRPATFNFIKIDLFVVRVDPFGLSRA